MSKALAIFVLIGAIYLATTYSGTSGEDIMAHPGNAAVNTTSLKFMQESYVPVSLQSSTKNGHKRIRTVLKVRNTSFTDSIYLSRIDYYDTNGALLKKIIESPVVVKPMTTMEIMVRNNEFKTRGDNFIVHSHFNDSTYCPFIQAVSVDELNRVLTIEHGVSTINNVVEIE